jgi:hypothetical protein
LVWAWAALQVGALIVGLVYASPAWVKVAEVAFTVFLVVYFVRARRWMWSLVLVVSVFGLVHELARMTIGNEDRSLTFVAYVLVFWIANLLLVLAPSVRRYFRDWRRAASA